MSKAYDRVEWDFLERIMGKLGFSESWIGRIMRGVRPVSYRVLVWGSLGDSFRPSRGLRQGDPLSPYLFLLCAEGLSSLLTKAEQCGNIHGVKVARGAPPVSQLFFADDCFIFISATADEGNALKKCLSDYAQAFGQKINFEKSAMSFSANMDDATREVMRELL